MVGGISQDEIAGFAKQAQFSGIVSLTPAEGPSLDLAFGLADRGHRVPNTIETRFATASGCKGFTAIAIGMLIDAGQVTLQTRLADCIHSRQFPFNPDVTLGHLLNHTAGIPDYFDEEVQADYGALWRERPCYGMTSTAAFLPLFERGAMKAPPGERFHYNNAGFILLGLAIEEVTGEDFRAFVQRRIFDPCGMGQSGYFAMDALPDNTAVGYLAPDEADRRSNIFSVPSIGGPDGGAFTTAGDMRRFWQALLSGRLLSPGLVERFTTPTVQTGPDDPAGHYGYGIWLQETPRGRIASVVGGDPGVSMQSGIRLSDGLVITVLSNVQYGATDMAQMLRERNAAA